MISGERLPLEAVWPEVRRRLLRFLHGRGTDASTAEDIVQEVALRVVAMDVSYESADDLMRWAATAARNLAIDQWRADARYGAVPLEEKASAVDVDETVEHRMRLEAVGQRWMQLSQRDRDALRSGALGTKASSRTEGVRWAVQRHAARARLAAMIDGVAGALVWLAPRLRFRSHKPARSAVIAAFPALVVAVVLLPHAIDVLTPHGPGDAPPGAGRHSQRSAVSTSTITTGPLADDGRETARPARRADATTPRAQGIVPYGRYDLTPKSSPVQKFVYTRPKQPYDSLVCVSDVPVVGKACVNPPLPPLPVP